MKTCKSKNSLKTRIVSVCVATATVIAFASCAQKNAGSDVMTGNDRDAHGCIGSAGYTWSEALQECVRMWEAGTRLERSGNESVFIVFTSDSAKVEVVFSTNEKKLILKRAGKTREWNKGKCILRLAQDGSMTLQPADGSSDYSNKGSN